MHSIHSSKPMNFMGILGQLIVLSILWVLCCLPIVTIGAASTALYYTVVKVLRRNTGSMFSSYFSAFRNNFSQSLHINMVFLTYFALLAYFAIPELLSREDGFTPAFYVICGLAFAGSLPLSISYPVISRFYHRGTSLIRFLLLLTGRYPHVVISCALLIPVSIVLVLSNGAALLFIPGCTAYIQSLMLEPVFKKYSQNTEASQYALWYDP